MPVGPGFTAQDALRYETHASGILLDTRATPGGLSGGSGQTFDWSKAREVRGRGGAHATIESTLAAADGGTTIGVVTDLALSGAVARYGRGIVQDVTEQLVTQFAEGLRRQLADPSVVATATADQPSSPVSGGRLVLRAIWNSITGLFRRG